MKIDIIRLYWLGNVCLICHYFRNISCRKVHDFDLDVQNGSRSNLNMLIESQYALLYLMAIVALSVGV